MLRVRSKCPSKDDLLGPIRWLLGKWRSIETKINCPSVESVDYVEELSIDHQLIGGPTVKYTSIARHSVEHNIILYQTGFLYVKPQSTHVYFNYANNQGVVATEEGYIQGKILTLKSRKIGQSSYFEQFNLKKIIRQFSGSKNGKTMTLTVRLQTPDKPMYDYLVCTYEKLSCQH